MASSDHPADGSDAADTELQTVFRSILDMDPHGSRFAGVIRKTINMLLDGPNTGRYRWEQLFKTEKTHCGTLIEINLQREFRFDDGEHLDYSIDGYDVDCKYSQRQYGWMIPPEAVGQLLLVVWANDEESRWSAGLVRAHLEYLGAPNRDRKRTLNPDGRAAVKWLFHRARLEENALLHIPRPDVDAILGKRSGQQRLNELLRRAQGRLLTRNVVHTVATGTDSQPRMDPLRRLRSGNEGARGQLRPEGIVILGDYLMHRAAAAALDLPIPGDSEFVSIRLARRKPEHLDTKYIVVGKVEWVIAGPDDPIELAPHLPAQ